MTSLKNCIARRVLGAVKRRPISAKFGLHQPMITASHLKQILIISSMTSSIGLQVSSKLSWTFVFLAIGLGFLHFDMSSFLAHFWLIYGACLLLSDAKKKRKEKLYSKRIAQIKDFVRYIKNIDNIFINTLICAIFFSLFGSFFEGLSNERSPGLRTGPEQRTCKNAVLFTISRCIVIVGCFEYNSALIRYESKTKT